jgi:hypothetical protein
MLLLISNRILPSLSFANKACNASLAFSRSNFFYNHIEINMQARIHGFRSKLAWAHLIGTEVWESVEHFRRAVSSPEFQSSIVGLPPSTVMSHHVFKKIAVPGICVG